MSELLRNALILDIETTGLRRGSGIHELAIYDLERKALREYTLDPNLVHVRPVTEQDRAKLVSNAGDVFIRQEQLRTWRDAVHRQIQIELDAQGLGEALQRQGLGKVLRWQNPFLARLLDAGLDSAAPRLLSGVEPPGAVAARVAQQNAKRTAALKAAGAAAVELDISRGIENLLRDELPRQLRGKTVWIANAAFEAKQLGAQLATADEQTRLDFKRMLETANPDSPDPFYVTGKEVTRARVLAQQTHDWTGVWRAYKQFTPRAGQTAVRDIQDVVRSMMSYGRQLGMFGGGTSYFGTSIDVVSQLFAHVQGQALGREVHRAAEDAAIHEAYVLRESVKYTQALQDVAERTTAGQSLVESAVRGEGALAELSQYFELLEQRAPLLQERNLLLRLQRARQDIAAEGVTLQRVGMGPRTIASVTPDDVPTVVYAERVDRRRFTTMDDLVGWLSKHGGYGDFGLDVYEQYARIKDVPDIPTLNLQVESRVRELDERIMKMNAVDSRRRLRGVVNRFEGKEFKAAINDFLGRVPGAGRLLAGAAATAVGFGVLGSVFQREKQPAPSMLHYGYRDWVRNKEIEGMSTQGVASERRPFNTDFGSPYRGPFISEEVFVDQELLNEREKWLRAQYGAIHHDPVTGIFGAGGLFKFFNGGYSYIQGGTPVDGERYGLRGNLMAINIQDGGWKVSVEDADTIVLKRGGVRGAISSFFGLNRGYSFRLAGVDAPELSHGSTSYHAPQPFAEDAAAAVKAMVAGSVNQTLVFDPTQTTYGRMMGALVVDGDNMNFELVRRGLAAHLPYGKREDSIIDYSALRKIEQQAIGVGVGMWSQPWAQAFAAVSDAAGMRVTLNTLAKTDSIVQNSGHLSMLSLMERSQRNGAFTERDSLVAQEIGDAYSMGQDQVGPLYYEHANAPHKNFLDEQLRDLSTFTRTKGRGGAQNKFSTRGGYGKLDNVLALDTMGTTNTVWNKRRAEAFELYETAKIVRRQRQAAEQRRINNMMFQSPIGHHRM